MCKGPVARRLEHLRTGQEVSVETEVGTHHTHCEQEVSVMQFAGGGDRLTLLCALPCRPSPSRTRSLEWTQVGVCSHG